MVYTAIESFIQALQEESEQISAERKAQLERLSGYIDRQLGKGAEVRLNFICTHNSRRSHLGQIWATVAAEFLGIKGIQTYSGGTEATAFNPRAVAALQRIGFEIYSTGDENPRYEIRYSDTAAPIIAWSKTFDDPSNPKRDFAAIMTCSDADENCPFIPGADFRIPLTYRDPKEADGTPEESARYDERARQIGRELVWMMREVLKKSPSSRATSP